MFAKVKTMAYSIGGLFGATIGITLLSALLSRLVFSRVAGLGPRQGITYSTMAAIIIALVVTGFTMPPSGWDPFVGILIYVPGGCLAFMLQRYWVFKGEWEANEKLDEPDWRVEGPSFANTSEESEVNSASAMDVSEYDRELDYSSSNFIISHWRGDLDLGIAYWVNAFLLTGIIGISLPFLSEWIATSVSSIRLSAAVGIIAIGFGLSVSIWASVGVWRSARRHESRGGNPTWAALAQMAVLIGFIGIVAQLSSTSATVRELANIATGNDPIGEPATVAVSGDGLEIILTGPLSEGAAAEFERVADLAPDARVVILSSEGGREFEARRISEFVAERGLDTFVEDDCLSACTMIFLAGVYRELAPGARLGFHQADFSGTTVQDRESMTASMRQFFRERGVRSPFIERAFDTPAEDMWFPTHRRLLLAGVADFSAEEVEIYPFPRENGLHSYWLLQDNFMSASQINAEAPTRTDEITILTGASAAENVLTFEYQLDLSANELDISAARSHMSSSVTAGICSNSGMHQAILTGAEYRFSYSDNSGNALFQIVVDEC
jgi:hypothetical protein